MKKVPMPFAWLGTFSFWDGLDVGIQSTSSIPDRRLQVRSANSELMTNDT